MLALGVLLPGLASAVFVLGQGLQINELQPANDKTLLDEDGDASDWIELWNPGAGPVDLGGFGLSDNLGAPFKWKFSPGAMIRPGEFMVVFASGKDRQPSLASSLAPDSVPGLRVWFRAAAVKPSDPAQARVAGDTVFLRQWQDLSGRGNHAIEDVESSQPTWLQAGPGGFPSVRFDGANDVLRLPQPVGTNDFCVFAVCRTSQSQETDTEASAGVGGTGGQHWLFGANHGGDLDAGAGISIGTNGISVYEHGSGYMPALAVYERPIGSGLQVICVNYSGRQPTIDDQGLAAHTGLVSTRRQIWAPVEIGAGAYGAFGGDILEVILFDRSLASDTRRGIARNLAERYNVPLPLPRHTSFQLSAGGEAVVLTKPDGTLVDSVRFGAVPREVSYGRTPGDPVGWYFFGTPTPGGPNTTPGSTAWLFPPDLSHPGGFYTNGFDLTLTNPDPGAEIRYTLNGSEPTTNSPLYGKPISIKSRTGTPNYLSTIPTVPGGVPPAGEVFKGWVVRARAFKAGAMPSAVITRTYWVHPKGAQRYSLPVIALATDSRNFFDPDVGIYVPGNAPGGNYSQRGPEWERPVHVEFYETNSLFVFAQDGDVKIHGNTSQNFPIKGLDLDATGGAGRKPFHHRMFPDRDRVDFDHFLLRPSGHDHGMAFMRDELMQELGAESGAESQAARACVVFLNGEYWGLHYLKEKEDADFVGFYGDVPADTLDYLEGYAVAKAGDTLHYDPMIQFIANNDPAEAANFEQIQTWMQVPNYIDYKVFEVFDYRWDIGNHRLWRPRTPEGRWRWLQFDNDVGWGGFWAEQPGWSYDMLAADLTTDGRLHGHNNDATTFLLRRLVLNASFKRDFINRFADLLNTILLPTNTIAHVDRLASVLDPEMAEHCQRWRVPGSLGDWRTSVEYLREYARRRPDYCRQHLAGNFSLPGTAQLSLGVSPSGAGRVQLNSLELSPTLEAPWKGTYFRGNPIHVRAEAQPGYRFTGWSGLPGVATNEVRLQLQGDWTLVAQFQADPASLVRLEARLDSPSLLLLTLSAAPNTRRTVESSPDLRTWASMGTVVLGSDGRGTTTAPLGDTTSRRFFRAIQP